MYGQKEGEKESMRLRQIGIVVVNGLDLDITVLCPLIKKGHEFVELAAGWSVPPAFVVSMQLSMANTAIPTGSIDTQHWCGISALQLGRSNRQHSFTCCHDVSMNHRTSPHDFYFQVGEH